MQTKQLTIDTYKKEYVYTTNYYDTNYGTESYRHPYIDIIQLSHKYEEGYYYSGITFRITFQQNLTKNDDGNFTNDGLPYAARIEDLEFNNTEICGKICKAIQSKIKELELYSKDQYSNILAALRASGYRKGYCHNSHVTSIE